jgi:hypothetical protein
MKVGGGGSERFMITVPLVIAFFISVYALGGPTQTLVLVEQFARDIWDALRNLLR